jgi:hypothetical protein
MVSKLSDEVAHLKTDNDERKKTNNCDTDNWTMQTSVYINTWMRKVNVYFKPLRTPTRV